MTIQMMTLIAVWCGNPIYNHNLIASVRTYEAIDLCRDRIVKCMKSVNAKDKDAEAQQSACAEKERLK